MRGFDNYSASAILLDRYTQRHTEPIKRVQGQGEDSQPYVFEKNLAAWPTLITATRISYSVVQNDFILIWQVIKRLRFAQKYAFKEATQHFEFSYHGENQSDCKQLYAVLVAD